MPVAPNRQGIHCAVLIIAISTSVGIRVPSGSYHYDVRCVSPSSWADVRRALNPFRFSVIATPFIGQLFIHGVVDVQLKAMHNVFRSLRILELVLQDCHFDQLPEKAFSNSTIFSVTLENCGLQKFPTRGLRQLDMLEALSLPRNRLMNVSHKALRFQSKALRYLDLAYNLFHELPVKALRRLSVLQVLNFSGNRIRHVPSRAFSNNSRLEALQLANNEITSIHDDAFQGIEATLVVLSLSHNPISGPIRAVGRLERLLSIELSSSAVSLLSIQQAKRSLVCLVLQGSHVQNVDLLNQFFGVVELDFSNNRRAADHNLLPPVFVTSFSNETGFSSCFSNVQRLDVSKSEFFPQHLQIFPNVRELYANGNSVRRLSEEHFIHTPFISKLELQNCSIRNVRMETFSRLPHLTDLDLSYNKLRRLNVRWFRNLENLKAIDLSHNNFKPFNRRLFSGSAQTLEVLSMSHNNLRSTPSALLRSLTNLKILRLNGNKIEQICQQFSNSYLEHLNLSGNRIQHIARHAFYNLTSLKTLDLSANRLSDISHVTFPSQLESLNLSSNQLRSSLTNQRQAHALMRLPASLMYLYLRDNKLTKLDISWVHAAGKSLLVVDISDNPILCSDCSLQPFVSFVKYHKIHLIGTCYAPPYTDIPITKFDVVFNVSQCHSIKPQKKLVIKKF